jgi:cell wall assembly regulator SMI1
MKRIWDRIHVWLSANAPEVLASLRPGASDEQIRAAEAVMGLALPDDVSECYRIHDGQEVTEGRQFPLDFLNGLGWNSLASMVASRRAQAELAARGDFIEYEGSTSEYLVRPRYHPRWAPLVQGMWGRLGLAFEGLDLDEPGGRIVISFREADLRGVVASSFREWLTRFVEELEAGVWEFEAGVGLARATT